MAVNWFTHLDINSFDKFTERSSGLSVFWIVEKNNMWSHCRNVNIPGWPVQILTNSGTYVSHFFLFFFFFLLVFLKMFYSLYLATVFSSEDPLLILPKWRDVAAVSVWYQDSVHHNVTCGSRSLNISRSSLFTIYL